MWISEQFAETPEVAAAGFGEVSIGGARSAVMAAGREQRLLPVIAPGGYAWLPLPGQRVLVLNEDAPCIAGSVQGETALEPGDVLIHAGSGSIRLSADGTIRLTGQVYLNGVPLGGNGNGN